MTTKEYIVKYKLDKQNVFNHNLFVQDLANDFIALLEINKAEDNLKGFDNAVRCIRMKYDAISNKTVGIFPEKLWNFFFATVIAKLREELCPRDMERKRLIQEEKKKAWEERKAFEQQEYDFWNRNFYSFLFANVKNPKPVESFTALGLPETATEQEVKTAFKKLAHIHHPDKGGKQDVFVSITDSKNKCLNWLETNS